jgi:hypothetical protein
MFKKPDHCCNLTWEYNTHFDNKTDVHDQIFILNNMYILTYKLGGNTINMRKIVNGKILDKDIIITNDTLGLDNFTIN